MPVRTWTGQAILCRARPVGPCLCLVGNSRKEKPVTRRKLTVGRFKPEDFTGRKSGIMSN